MNFTQAQREAAIKHDVRISSEGVITSPKVPGDFTDTQTVYYVEGGIVRMGLAVETHPAGIRSVIAPTGEKLYLAPPRYDPERELTSGNYFTSQADAEASRATAEPQASIPPNDNTTVALAAAQYAHDAYFSSRRGSLPSDGHLLVAYDNNPYKNDLSRRERQVALVIEMMRGKGYGEPSRASYPADGEAKGYTIALVWDDIRNHSAAERKLCTIWKQVIADDLTPVGEK